MLSPFKLFREAEPPIIQRISKGVKGTGYSDVVGSQTEVEKSLSFSSAISCR
jgi:hypothetical protein